MLSTIFCTILSWTVASNEHNPLRIKTILYVQFCTAPVVKQSSIFFLFQVPFADALDLVRGRKVYLENVRTLSKKDTRYFFNIRKMKREAQISNNLVT